MGRAVDIAYLVAAAATAPLWLARMALTGKLRTDWKARFGHCAALGAPRHPRVLIHAVSVGEVNAVRLLVDMLRQGEEPCEVVLATTTDTGQRRARELYGDGREGVAVVRFPFDFSVSVDRFLDAVRPDLVALVELEVWPNFTQICAERRIPVLVVNGRLSARSFARYRRVRRFVEPMFRRLAKVAAQSDLYATRFALLGVPERRMVVTGTVKWDAAQIADDAPGSDALAESLGIDRTRPLVVAGSTAPGEPEILHRALPKGVQLLCAPRKPEWFNRAARALPGCARRSRGERGSASDRYLLDSIGELRAAYALADIVVMGRTFVPKGGSDMIEPIGLGKVTVVGPHVDNFEESVESLERGGGIVRADARSLGETLGRLLGSADERRRIAEAGRMVIRREQGATLRTAEAIRAMIPPDRRSGAADAESASAAPRPEAVSVGRNA